MELGVSWNWSVMELECHGTGVSWNWSVMELECHGTGVHGTGVPWNLSALELQCHGIMEYNILYSRMMRESQPSAVSPSHLVAIEVLGVMGRGHWYF